MEDFEEPTRFSFGRRLVRHQQFRKWLLVGSIALALMGILGTEALLGSTLVGGQVLAAGPSKISAKSGGAVVGLRPTWMPTMMPGTPGSQCGGQLTVSQVTSRSITVTRADGSTVTVHVTGRTQYTRNGTAVSVSAVKVGSQIYVVGTCGSHGNTITATTIEIVS